MPHFLRVGNVTGGIGWLATTVFAQQKRTWKLKNVRIGKEHHLSRPWCWGFHVHFHGVVQHLDSEYSCNSCDCKNIHGQYLPGSKNNDITKLGFISTYNYLCVEQKGKYKIASAFFSIQNYQYKISIFQKNIPRDKHRYEIGTFVAGCFLLLFFGRLPFICIFILCFGRFLFVAGWFFGYETYFQHQAAGSKGQVLYLPNRGTVQYFWIHLLDLRLRCNESFEWEHRSGRFG